MAIGSTNAIGIYINPEASWGETPSSPVMQSLRFTGESLAFAKQTVVSDTIRTDRMRDQIALVGWNTQGELNFELEFFDYDDLLSGALFANWVGAFSKTGTTIAATSTTITDSGNGFGSVPVNSYIWVTGFATASLNRRYRVTAATAGALTVSPAPATTEAASASVTVSCGGIAITAATTTLTITVAGSTVTFGGTTGFNPTTASNLVVGQWVYFSGFAQAANNGLKRISALTATTIVVEQTLTSESVTATTVIKIAGRRLRNGTTQRSFHIEKAFTDINQYMSMRGMTVNGAKLEINSGEIIKGSFDLMGKTVVRSGSTNAASLIAQNTTTLLTASNNIGAITQNGTAVSVGIKSISLDIANNLRMSEQIGSLYPYALGYGFMDVTGQIEVYFENSTLYDQLINHTSTSLSWPMTDDAGNTYVITLPSVIFTEGYPMGSGGNDDVTIPLSFQAVRNSTYNCQIQIDQLPSFS